MKEKIAPLPALFFQLKMDQDDASFFGSSTFAMDWVA
jgi:hypothetical protein